jgi:hypothetical protein
MRIGKTIGIGSAIIIAALLPLAAIQSGCTTAVSAVAYVRGELTATVNYPLAKVQKTTVKVLKSDLRYVSVSEKEDATSAQYRFLNAKDDKIVVTLDYISDDATKISICIGTFGDENLSNLILERVRNRLR